LSIIWWLLEAAAVRLEVVGVNKVAVVEQVVLELEQDFQ
jgi:hypothetical protein